jgi:hypothetical protein
VRYRQLSPLGDYTIGLPFYVNDPQAVAQAVYTRLKLWLGEFFLDVTDGTAYLTGVLAERYGKNPDAIIKARILGTTGVTAINSYSSTFNGPSRTLTVSANLQTAYSAQGIDVSVPLSVGNLGH